MVGLFYFYFMFIIFFHLFIILKPDLILQYINWFISIYFISFYLTFNSFLKLPIIIIYNIFIKRISYYIQNYNFNLNQVLFLLYHYYLMSKTSDIIKASNQSNTQINYNSPYYYDQQTLKIYTLATKQRTQYTQIQTSKQTVNSKVKDLQKQIKKLIQKQQKSKSNQSSLKQKQNNAAKQLQTKQSLAIKLYKLKNLQKQIDTKFNQHDSYRLYYDKQTKQLTKAIKSNKNKDQIHQNRQKVIKIFQNIANSQHFPNRQAKLRKLKKLLWLTDQKIQALQQKHILPISLAKRMEDSSGDYLREINFFLIVAWIISFLLANKDQSVCLDSPIQTIVITFRGWLWINGGCTLYLTVFLIMFNLTRSVKQQQEQQDDEAQNQQSEMSNLIQVNPNPDPAQIIQEITSKKEIKTSKIKKLNLCLVFLTGLGVLFKFIWIFFGIGLFLVQLDFGDCSDNVLNYCSLQFLAFFSFAMYIVLGGILKQVKKCRQMPKETTYPKNDQQLQQIIRKNDSIDQQKIQEINLYIEGDFDDIQDLLGKVVVWTLIGWVYDFILWKKDKSLCLDQTFDNFSLTYRNWLLVDGICSLVMFAYFLLIVVVFTLNRQSLMIWRQKENYYHINLDWIKRYKVLSILFILLTLFKFAWLILGVIILCLNVNLMQCSGNVPNFLIAYFTQTVYVAIEASIMIVRGYRRTKSSQPKKQQKLEESRQQLTHNNKLSPIKNKQEIQKRRQIK